MKPFYRSKTIQLAILQAALGLAIVFATESKNEGLLLVLKSAYDIFLRYKTTEPVS